jgi:glycosyltransferase involved in cell wall biosynthesis
LSSLRIAYLGPAPQQGGGVAGVAALLLDELLQLGHTIDCFVAGLDIRLPENLRERSGFTFVEGRSSFRYDLWYSRTELTKFVTGQAMRALAERRLAGELAVRHRAKPYDVVYQFSHIEVFRVGGRHRTPPLVVHPETHAAGELRWLKLERALSRRCEPLHRRAAARGILGARTLMQQRHTKLASGFICPSRAFQRTLCRDYEIDPALTRVVPNPIDLTSFQPRPGLSRSDGPIRVLYVSRLSVRKGVETVVELSRRLDDLAGSIVIHVIGGRTQWSDYSRLLDDLNLRVASYRGSISAEEMPALMAGSDLLIQPSKYEPFGLTVGEALASGLPVVVTDEVGAAEDVSSQCARVVPAGDVEALESEVRLLVTQIQSGQTAQLRGIARSEAERLFEPRNVAESVARALGEFAAIGFVSDVSGES